MAGLIEAGCWAVDEGPAAGRYGSANEAVRAVHGGTSRNAWLYVVLAWEGGWKDADDVRRMQATQLNFVQESRLTWCAREIRKKPNAKGLSEGRIMMEAARRAASMADD